MEKQGKRIVIALGGNALGHNLEEQMAAARQTAGVMADLIAAGHEIVISHGNGPQVGMIYNAMTGCRCGGGPPIPLSVCVAMSQGYIGYDLENCLREELVARGIHKPVSSVPTQVLVDPDDSAFDAPTKPIGPFLTREQAEALREREGCAVAEDAGRGYRRVVPSPLPCGIVEIESVRTLLEGGQVVIACGGGGVPVIRQGNGITGVNAVVDKDFASAVLAEELDADFLIILTAVEKVALHFGEPDEEWLSRLSAEQAETYIRQGHFSAGSMLPKIEAAVAFARSGPGRQALITLLEKAADGIAGKTGTLIEA